MYDSQDQLSNFLHVFFPSVIDKKFYVSLNERLAIKYVNVIIIKGFQTTATEPLFSSCMYDLLLELCFRVNDKTKNNFLSRNTKIFKARHAYIFGAYK